MGTNLFHLSEASVWNFAALCIPSVLNFASSGLMTFIEGGDGQQATQLLFEFFGFFFCFIPKNRQHYFRLDQWGES